VLYLGDYDLAGNQIEANTRRILEREVGPLNWVPGGESRGGVPSTEMTENEADERLGMAFPLDLPPFIAHFPAHRKRISCYEPSREITTGSNFEAPPRRGPQKF
jgi:hypothetical protein